MVIDVHVELIGEWQHPGEWDAWKSFHNTAKLTSNLLIIIIN